MSARNSAPQGLLTPGFKENQKFDFIIPDDQNESFETDSSNGLDDLSDDEDSDDEDSEMLAGVDDDVSSVGSLRKLKAKHRRRNGLLR